MQRLVAFRFRGLASTIPLALPVVALVCAASATTLSPPCALAAANPSVTIFTPGASATLSLPIHIVAGVNDSNAVVSLKLLVDGIVVYNSTSSPLDTYLTSLGTGG